MAHGASPRHSRKPKARRTASPKRTGSGSKKPAGPPVIAPVASTGPTRLQKLLASAGFGSRREVEAFLRDQRVTVNGRVSELGDRADPAFDKICLDGERVLRDPPTYWLVNKPRGVVTTLRDDEGRRTVLDLLPRKAPRLFPVGRLDRETSGLLLMTNDGDAAHVLLHPSLGNEREYRVNVKGQLDEKKILRLERGVALDEGKAAPTRVEQVRFDSDSKTTSLTLTLVEGKKRQIRRSFLILGNPVRRLVRVRMGPMRLGRLAVGEARPLRADEKRQLLEHVRRLRAGEVPEKPRPTRGSQLAGSAKTTLAPSGAAAPPRAKTARRARGADEDKAPARGRKTKARGKTSTSGRSRSGSKPTGPARKRAGKKAAGARPGKKSTARKPSGARKKTAAKRRSGGAGAARKSSAGRRPQRGVSSRKGTRK